MTTWCVLIAAAADDETEPELGPDAVDAFVDALVAADPDGERPLVSAGSHRWSARLIVDSDTAAGALPVAAERCYGAGRKVGLPRWPIVRIGVVRAAELRAATVPADDSATSAEPAPPSGPERPYRAGETAPTPSPAILVGVTEVAGIFGVSRQRASEVARMRGFPAPIAELASGPVWQRPDVLRFAETWERKPGRPRKWPPPAAAS